MSRFASTQVNLPVYLSFLHSKVAQSLPKSILEPAAHEPDGIEHEAHITVLYGIDPAADYEAARSALSGVAPFLITFGTLGFFKGVEKGTADCVYVSILPSQGLDDLRLRLKPFLDPEIDSSRPYVPHCTLAYIKLGMAEPFENLGPQICDLTGKSMLVQNIIFSTSDDRRQHEITLQKQLPDPINPFALTQPALRSYMIESIKKRHLI